MNISSILVYSSPGYFDEVYAALVSLPGVEVHYQCGDTGRMIVIQETPDGGNEMDGLRQIKTLPHILTAELVYHYQDQGSNQELSPYSAKEALS